MEASQGTDDLARQTQEQEWEAHTHGSWFCVVTYFSTTQIPFKCFQPCQTKVMFAAKISHFALYSHIPGFE